LEVDLLRGLSPPRQQLRRFDWRNDPMAGLMAKIRKWPGRGKKS
jgi:hypothetical protein